MNYMFLMILVITYLIFMPVFMAVVHQRKGKVLYAVPAGLFWPIYTSCRLMYKFACWVV